MQVKRMRVALLCATGMAFGALAAPASAEKIEGQYICVFQPSLVAKGAVRAEAAKSAAQGGGAVTHTYQNTIRGFAMNASAQGMAKMMAHNPRIAYCEQDQVMTTVQGKPGGGSTPPAETTPWGVTRVGGGLTGSTRKAWVIDTGVDYTHPDLNVNTALSKTFIARTESADDDNGHGSHVGGTIGAIKDNGIGYVGVAPGVSLVAVKVLDRRGSGSNSGVIAGVDYAGGAFAAGDVANMSLGGGFSQALNDAVIAAAAKGLKFALAAGNESTSATTKSPASANGPNIYTISSFAQGDRWSSFSNYGNPPVDFAEPGSSIPSTYKDGGYATLSGTSMAAPHMAGLLLLGTPRSGGTVTGDPDGNADTIGIN